MVNYSHKFLLIILLCLVNNLICQERINPEKLQLIECSEKQDIEKIHYKDQNGFWETKSSDRSIKIFQYSLNNQYYYVLESNDFNVHDTKIFTHNEFRDFKAEVLNFSSSSYKLIKTYNRSDFFSRTHPPTVKELTGLINGTQTFGRKYIGYKVVELKDEKYIRLSFNNSDTEIKNFETYYSEIKLDVFVRLFNLTEVQNQNKKDSLKLKYQKKIKIRNTQAIKLMNKNCNALCDTIAVQYLPRYKKGSYFYNTEKLFKSNTTSFNFYAMMTLSHWTNSYKLFTYNEPFLDSLIQLDENELDDVFGLRDSILFIITNSTYSSTDTWKEGIFVYPDYFEIKKVNLETQIIDIDTISTYSSYQRLLTLPNSTKSLISINEASVKSFTIDRDLLDIIERDFFKGAEERERKLEEEKLLIQQNKNDSLKTIANSFLKNLSGKYITISKTGKKKAYNVSVIKDVVLIKNNRGRNKLTIDMLNHATKEGVIKLRAKGYFESKVISSMTLNSKGEFELSILGGSIYSFSKVK